MSISLQCAIVTKRNGAIKSQLGVQFTLSNAHALGEAEGGMGIFGRIGRCAAMGDDAEVGWHRDGQHHRLLLLMAGSGYALRPRMIASSRLKYNSSSLWVSRKKA